MKEIHPGQSLKGADIVSALAEIKIFKNIIHKKIQVDNGSEFISNELDRWAYENNVTLDTGSGSERFSYNMGEYGPRIGLGYNF